jgi:hypothetical protein
MRTRTWLLAAPLLAVGCASEPVGGPADAGGAPDQVELLRSDGPPPPTPEEVRAALERGLRAASEGDNVVAARHFFLAWTLDPASAESAFNVGLAKARAGRDLDAIPWLEAYLALRPEAENAGAVRAELERLAEQVEAAAKRLIQAALAAHGKLDEKERQLSFPTALARLGRIDDAVRVSPKGEAFREEALRLAERKRLERIQYGLRSTGARPELLEAIRAASDPDARRPALRAFIERLVVEGRVDAARKLIPELDEYGRERLQETLAERYLELRDEAAIEALLPSLPGAARARVLLNLVGLRASKGDAAGAERLLDRVELAEASPVSFVGAALNVALVHARAGRAAEVKALGRRLLPVASAATSERDRPRIRGVAAFLLGNVEAGLAETARAELLPTFLYTYDYFGRHHLFAIGLLVAGLLGRDDDAATIRAAFERRVRAEDEDTYLKYASRWMDWAEACIHLQRGEQARTLQAFRRIHPKLQPSVLPLYVAKWLEAGRPDVAESIVWAIDEEPCDLARHRELNQEAYVSTNLVRARVEALLRVAEAAGAETRRLLRAATRIVRRSNQVCVLERPLLEQLATAQDQAGDAEGAAETRRLLLPPEAAAWLSRALLDWPLDAEQLLKDRLKEASPGAVPETILGVAQDLLDALHRLRH